MVLTTDAPVQAETVASILDLGGFFEGRAVSVEGRRWRMRAVVIPRHGGPEVLEVRELPDPPVGEGKCGSPVRAAGINWPI